MSSQLEINKAIQDLVEAVVNFAIAVASKDDASEDRPALSDSDLTSWRILQGEAIEELRSIKTGSVDALVTDPPAGIGFRGKEWDKDRGGKDSWVREMGEIFNLCRHAMKPGAHALVWALPRTAHWTAYALEAGGFEIRDVVCHIFGTGFPKSRNLKREWQGWGTGLKPASENWILARVPLDGTVAGNVETHGVGGIHIDGCRVESTGEYTDNRVTQGVNTSQTSYVPAVASRTFEPSTAGRWPPNLLLTHAPDCGETCVEGCPVAIMDEQSGVTRSGSHKAGNYKRVGYGGDKGGPMGEVIGDGDGGGGASRFFPRFRYVRKASRTERLEGATDNDHPTVKSIELMSWLCRLITPPGGLVLDPFLGSGSTMVAALREEFRCLGIERDSHYADIAQRRVLERAKKVD